MLRVRATRASVSYGRACATHAQVFEKTCVLNYHDINDPFDTDNNGLTTAAFSQWTTEQLIVVDDYCLIAGTDTNFPGTNQFGLTQSNTPHLQETFDTRWMIVCYYDPIFGAAGIDQHNKHVVKSSAPATCTNDGAAVCPAGSSCKCVVSAGRRARHLLFANLPARCSTEECYCLP